MAQPGVSIMRPAQAVSFLSVHGGDDSFLDANAALPIFRTETLSTQSDNQDGLTVKLSVQGDTPIVSLRFPIQQRASRGVPMIALTVRVSATGAMSLTLVEPGSDNILDRDGLTARVLA